MSGGPDTLTAEEFAKLVSHLERFPKAEECPVCGGVDWDAPTIKEHQVFVQDRFQRMTGTLVVSLVCVRCYHVRCFAWSGIERSAACSTSTDSTTGSADCSG
jgi:hypothetical protein